MHRADFVKPDGRRLALYGRAPVRNVGPLLPMQGAVDPNPHLRWHPLLGTWVAYASYRQHRTFLPPAEFNPLQPSADGDHPTELPTGDYDVAVFDNLFPTLAPQAHDPPDLGWVSTAAGIGQCEVVVYSQDPSQSLGQLPLDHVELLVEVWGDRTAQLGARESVAYVLPFENRGVEVGVTLHHPHGQVYAYPFVPAVPARVHHIEEAHYRKHGVPLLQQLIEREIRDDRRLLYLGEHAVAWVPAWARYPYEAWVAPRIAVARLDLLGAAQRADLACALKALALRYDGLWSRPFPYLMHWYQAPTDAGAHPEVHLHAEFHPAYRAPGKLKFLAGTELGAGMFANDALPEDTARELAAVDVRVEA